MIVFGGGSVRKNGVYEASKAGDEQTCICRVGALNLILQLIL